VPSEVYSEGYVFVAGDLPLQPWVLINLLHDFEIIKKNQLMRVDALSMSKRGHIYVFVMINR